MVLNCENPFKIELNKIVFEEGLTKEHLYMS